MDNNIHETIKDIKSKFRLFMNGMVSQSMREKGMEYKLNFGIEYPRIKEIAAGYEPDHELAQALWKEIAVRFRRRHPWHCASMHTSRVTIKEP